MKIIGTLKVSEATLARRSARFYSKDLAEFNCFQKKQEKLVMEIWNKDYKSIQYLYN